MLLLLLLLCSFSSALCMEPVNYQLFFSDVLAGDVNKVRAWTADTRLDINATVQPEHQPLLNSRKKLFGRTALGLAALSADYQMALLLLRARADVNKTEGYRANPLHTAIKLALGSYDVHEQSDGNVKLKEVDDLTEKRRGAFIDLLLEHGADVGFCNGGKNQTIFHRCAWQIRFGFDDHDELAVCKAVRVAAAVLRKVRSIEQPKRVFCKSDEEFKNLCQAGRKRINEVLAKEDFSDKTAPKVLGNDISFVKLFFDWERALDIAWDLDLIKITKERFANRQKLNKAE